MQPNTVSLIKDGWGSLVNLLQQWYKVLNQISFGTYTNAAFQPGNIDGVIVKFNFAIANNEYAIAHSLQRVPTGYIVIGTDVAASVYQLSNTGTAWTSSNIYLKSSAICNAMLFIF